MKSFLIAEASETMWFKRLKTPKNHTEERLRIIHEETYKSIDRATASIDRATASIDKLNDLLDDPNLGITGNIFLATGGDRRTKRNTK